MKLIAAVATALAAAIMVPAASADYRVPLFACSVGNPGANLVPANTPLYFSSGWTSGTRGLVQDAVNDAVFTYTDTINGITTAAAVVWTSIVQDNLFFEGSWSANFRVDFPPLAVGEKATITQTLAWAHPLIDLGLPTRKSGSGLLYFDMQPAGSSAWGELTPITCTITAT